MSGDHGLMINGGLPFIIALTLISTFTGRVSAVGIYFYHRCHRQAAEGIREVESE